MSKGYLEFHVDEGDVNCVMAYRVEDDLLLRKVHVASLTERLLVLIGSNRAVVVEGSRSTEAVSG